MKKLVFATNNAHKLTEVKALLAKKYDVISLAELNCFDDIPETAETLEGNAFIKANYIHQKFGVDCFADDTGLEIEALNGEPGVYSARYAGKANNAVENMKKVLSKLGEHQNRKARFRTVMTLIIGGETHYFEGEVRGTIASTPKGENGFGYDPIFIPDNNTLSFAELDIATKNEISHRALAVKKLVAYLNNRI